MTDPEEDHWLARPATIRKLWAAFIAVLAGLVALDLVVSQHPHFALDRLFAFNAWFGFLACVALIVGAKVLGAIFKRSDTYYDG